MLRILLSLTGILFGFLSAFSQNYSVSSIPDSIRENSVAVVREYSVDIDIRSSGKISTNERRVITVFDKEAAGLLDLYKHYNSSIRIKHLSAKTYNAAGKLINQYRTKDFSDVSAVSSYSVFEDNRIKYLRPLINEYPFTIEFEASYESKDYFFSRKWTPYLIFKNHIGSEKANLTIHADDSDGFRYKVRNSENSPEHSSEDKEVKLKWAFKNLAPLKGESFGPQPETIMPHIIIGPKTINTYGYTGNMTDWKSIGEWQKKLLAGRQNLPEKTLVDIRNLTAETNDTLEQIKKIYEYVQSKTRYVSIQVGIGGWQPFTAEFTDEKSYGDCKALTNYTLSLLQAAGIPSHYTLVKAGSQAKTFYSDFPSRDFNHAILCVPIKEDTVWLECTNDKSPFGHLGTFTDNRDVLIITEQGGKIAHTKYYKPGENLKQQKNTVFVQPNGNANAKTETNYFGLRYDESSQALSLSPKEQKKRIYSKLDIPDFTLNTFEYSDESTTKQAALNEKLDIDIIGFAKKSGKRLFVEMNFTNKIEIRLDENERKHDIHISRGFTDSTHNTFVLPEGSQVEYLPEAESLKTEFGQFSFSAKHEGNTITYERKLVIKDGVFPKEKYKEFVEFLETITKADKAKAVVIPETN
jgi:transglutaminase-like putative cysteine protease